MVSSSNCVVRSTKAVRSAAPAGLDPLALLVALNGIRFDVIVAAAAAALVALPGR